MFQVFVSPKLAGLVLSIVPPVVLFSVVYGRYVRRITKKVQDALADASQVSMPSLLLSMFAQRLQYIYGRIWAFRKLAQCFKII